MLVLRVHDFEVLKNTLSFPVKVVGWLSDTALSSSQNVLLLFSSEDAKNWLSPVQILKKKNSL